MADPNERLRCIVQNCKTLRTVHVPVNEGNFFRLINKWHWECRAEQPYNVFVVSAFKSNNRTK